VLVYYEDTSTSGSTALPPLNTLKSYVVGPCGEFALLKNLHKKAERLTMLW